MLMKFAFTHSDPLPDSSHPLGLLLSILGIPSTGLPQFDHGQISLPSYSMILLDLE